MNVDDVYKLMLYAVAKNNSQGYLSPDEFNRVIQIAARSYLDYLLGEYQKYQQGRAIPVVQFGENETVKTSLIPLIYQKILPVTTSGIADYPSDFEQVDAMWTLYGYYNIKFTQQDALSSRVRSVISPVSRNPVYVIQHEGFHFFPENISSARLSYIRTPPDMVWKYTEDLNGLPMYDSVNSIQPIWADSDLLNLIVRALNIVGVNLQLGVLIQYSNEIKNTGQ